MVRRILWFVALASCPPASSTTPPSPAVTQPAPPAVVEPVRPKASAASESMPQTPGALRVEEGWVRTPNDPSVPLIQLEHADDHGESAAAVLDAIVGSAGGILGCWEVAVAAGAERGSLGLQVRHPRDPADDLLRVDVGQDAGPEVQRCVDAAVREHISMPDEGDVASVRFRLFRHRSDGVLRTLDPGGEVAIRTAGSCWQWKEEGACPPRKRCYVSRWIRTSCGTPTMRDDVSVHFGVSRPNGERARLLDARLVGGDGTVLWRTPLPDGFVAGYGESVAAQEDSIAAATSAFGVRLERQTVVIADAVGLQIYSRTTGKSLLRWAAPERGKPALWFDDGKYTILRGKEVCEGDAGHGGWYAECGDRRVYFDGHSLAVFRLSTAEFLETQRLGQGKNRLTGSGPLPSAVISAGGVRVEVRGNVYMQ